NGGAEAAFEAGKGYFLGVDSDQEMTFNEDLAAITMTSGMKNIGNSLIWVFDELDKGNEHWGTEVTLGIAEGGVGLVTDKNFAKYASDECKAAIEAAEAGIVSGEIPVSSDFTDHDKVMELRDSVKP
ncbi:basic membrane protein, partial [gut metagenome]